MSAAALAAASAAPAADAERNGFDLSNASVPALEILHGGPPRDGIPALSAPATLAAPVAPWPDDEIVMGVELGGEARAYPLSMLNWHELVNDTLGGEPLLVSFCPLCGTGLVFHRKIGGQLRSFGVSGLLYRSDLLLYDRESESLWSQISSTAVSGPARGQRLQVLRSSTLRWGSWKAQHPHTTVLSPDTGHGRDYAASPYGDYARSERLIFPVPLDPRYHAKMPAVALRLGAGPSRIYPASELLKAGGRIEDQLGEQRVVVAFDPDEEVFAVSAPAEIEVVEGYWFALIAFHPEASVFVSTAGPSGAQKEDLQ